MNHMTSTELHKLKVAFYAAIPLFIAVPAGFLFVFQWAGHPVIWSAFGLGALGWWIALLLRGPVALLSRKLPQERGQAIVVASSGLMEESVRVVMLLLLSTAFSYSLSFGQGWAAIEVLYALVSGFALLSLYGKTDEKAMQAKELLAAQGHRPSHPLWGVIERVSASLFHLGAALLLAKSAWLVLLMIPLHSALNMYTVRLSKRSMQAAELFIAIVGVSVFAWGWYM